MFVTNVTKNTTFQKLIFLMLKYIYIALWLLSYMVTNQICLEPQLFFGFRELVTKDCGYKKEM